MTIGDAIRRIRKRRGENQTEFARVLRCRQSSVSRFERGLLAPGPLVLIGLLDSADPEGKSALIAQMDAGRLSTLLWLARTPEERAPLEEALEHVGISPACLTSLPNNSMMQPFHTTET